MLERPAATDRRAALKARHRQAILDAADALIAERRDVRFSVDELAERADVSRRTVFNHFASLDDVVMSVCTQVLTGAVEEFRVAAAATPVGDGTRASLFAEVTLAMRGIDLPAVIGYLWGVLGVDVSNGRSHQAVQEVFTRATSQLADELEQRSSSLDRLEIDLLISSMMNGIAVIAQHWITETGAALDDASREVWARLLDRMITSIRAGYAPAAPTAPTASP